MIGKISQESHPILYKHWEFKNISTKTSKSECARKIQKSGFYGNVIPLRNLRYPLRNQI